MKADDHGKPDLDPPPSHQPNVEDENYESKQARRALLFGFVIGIAIAAFTSKITPTEVITRKPENPNRLPAEVRVHSPAPSLQSE